MIIFKSGKVSKQEKEIINNILIEYTDIWKDCYITKNNLRLFLADNKELLYEGLVKGDKIAFDENQGLIFICGYSDKFPRKYLKILAKNEDSANRLLKILSWNIKDDLYAKMKKSNPIIKVLERNGFRYIKDRGAEALLFRKYLPTRPIKQKDKNEE